MASIMERSNKLLGRVATVHGALLDIVTLTSSSAQTDGTITSDSVVHEPFTPTKGKLHSTMISSTSISDKRNGSNKATPQHDQKTSSTRTLSPSNRHANTMVHLTTPTHKLTQLALTQIGSAGDQVLNHFCKLVSEAVVKSVLQSHDRFIQSLGTNPAVLHHSEAGSLSAAGPGQAQSCLDLGTEEISQLKEKHFQTPPICVGREGEQMQSETPLKYTYQGSSLKFPETSSSPMLQLMVEVHFATPRIQVDPTLDKVHSDLLEVSEALLRVLHQVKWWSSTNVGRTLYDVFEISAREDAMYNSIRGPMQSKEKEGRQVGYCKTLSLPIANY